MDVKDVLQERGSVYGSFDSVADISQRLKSVVNGVLDDRNKSMSAPALEALDMICNKLARILNGDPDYPDNWVDIAGYATLVADRLIAEAWGNDE